VPLIQVSTDATDLVTPGRRLTDLASQRPTETAIIELRGHGGPRFTTWAELETSANRLARRLAEDGVGVGDFVAIGLPTCGEHVVAAWATWKLGGCPMPVSHHAPAPERDRLLDLGKAATIVAEWDDLHGIDRDEIRSLKGDSGPRNDDAVPNPMKALASGGSTGLPKLIVTPGPFAYPEGTRPLSVLDVRDRDVVFFPGPLYHNQPFLGAHLSLYSGATIVINERFDPVAALDAIERFGVTGTSLVPTHLSRMLRVPDIGERDLSSLRMVLHMAAPCPESVKRAWIDLVGAEHVFEVWGTTEGVGSTIIRGDEWLAHPGSVGRTDTLLVRILDDDGNAVLAGQVGELYTRDPGHTSRPFTYLGAPAAKQTTDGLISVGDLAWVDKDGYLYLADRRRDLIITGGANVFPAEVESAIASHPGVADVAVIGVADEDMGQLVHAIVQPVDPSSPPLIEELDGACRSRIASYKRPRSWEFVTALPRADNGKIRRSDLHQEG